MVMGMVMMVMERRRHLPTGSYVGLVWPLRSNRSRSSWPIFSNREPTSTTLGRLAVDETVNLLHSPLPLIGVSIVMERERQRNDGLVTGYGRLPTAAPPSRSSPSSRCVSRTGPR